jgi:hypothetical protein
LLTRLDDLLNPIVVKELRQAVKSRLVVFALLLFLTLQVVILGLFLMWRSADTGRRAAEMDFQAGRQVFVVLQGILLGTCMLLVPAYAGVRLGVERSDSNVDLLFISTLRPRSIIAGKFFAAFVLILLIFSACAPFMTFTYLLRGLDIPTILLVLGIDLLAVLAGTQLMIFLGTIPGHWVFKVLLGLFGFGWLMIIFWAALGSSVMLLEMGLPMPLDSWEFWAMALAILAGVLGIMGLWFVWSVALVSPPSSNRALPVRIFMLAQWLVTGAAAAAWSRQLSEFGPVGAWGILQVMLFGLQLVIAINEREQWSPRVARRIPRWRLWRLPAFLFYSGSAGGLTFGALFIGLTLLAYRLWDIWYPSSVGRPRDETATILEALLVACLYTLCYCLLAVLVRSYLFTGRIKLTHTWVLWLTLVGIGSALPHIVDYIVFYNDYTRPYSYEIDWWLLPNPFAAVLDITHSHRSSWTQGFESRGLWFSSTWAVLMVLASSPWYAQQLLRFHPPAAPTPAGGGHRPSERSLGGLTPSAQEIHTPRSPSEISR